jgi:hypothetical protein
MAVLFKNNAHSTLASSITDSATSITLASGHGTLRFPTTGSPDYFFATLIDSSNNIEVVKCTARSSDVLTVTRAQESTSARAFSTGDRIELRITAQGLTDLHTTWSGVSGFTAGDILYASNTTTLAKLAKGTAGQVLKMNGGASAPEWAASAAATYPTITGIAPTVAISSTTTTIVITGTNYVITPNVEIINSNGVISYPLTVVRNSATQLTITVNISTKASYFLRVENPDGLAARTGAILSVSDAPTFSTNSGSLGEGDKGAALSFDVDGSSDSTVAFSKISGAFPSGLSLNTATGVISGTENGSQTSTTVYNFTLRLTDAESQTADRAFSISVSVGMANSGQFN